MIKMIGKKEKDIKDSTLGELQSDNIFSYILSNINYSNIEKSLDNSNKEIIKVYSSLEEFGAFPNDLFSSDSELHSRTAFLIFQHEAYQMAKISAREALMGNYTTAYILLRNYFELLIRGAYWECLAHKKYRHKIKSETKPKPNKESKMTLKGSIEELIKIKPELKDSLEILSAKIYDIITVIYENKSEFKKMIRNDYNKGFHLLSLEEMVKELAELNIFDPIDDIHTENPVDVVYQFYRILSRYAHAEPDKTHIGRRIFLNEKDIFSDQIIEEELKGYLNSLHNLVDLGLLIELNLLEDLAAQNKEYIEERLPVIIDLELYHAATKIEKILDQNKKD